MSHRPSNVSPRDFVNELPDEILLSILKYASEPTFFTLRLVCSRWARIVDDDSYFLHVITFNIVHENGKVRCLIHQKHSSGKPLTFSSFMKRFKYFNPNLWMVDIGIYWYHSVITARHLEQIMQITNVISWYDFIRVSSSEFDVSFDKLKDFYRTLQSPRHLKFIQLVINKLTVEPFLVVQQFILDHPMLNSVSACIREESGWDFDFKKTIFDHLQKNANGRYLKVYEVTTRNYVCDLLTADELIYY